MGLRNETVSYLIANTHDSLDEAKALVLSLYVHMGWGFGFKHMKQTASIEF